jgi:hypothetical protein
MVRFRVSINYQLVVEFSKNWLITYLDDWSFAAAAATLEFHLSSSATTHIQRILVGKNAPKLRSEIAIFKTIGFEQVPII